MGRYHNSKIFYFAFALIISAQTLFAEGFPIEPPESFKLKPQYIALHHPVTTSEVIAQLYFDQGLTFIYAFNHDAAYWSFLRAIQSDPKMAMAYWGVALALGANINTDITPERSRIAYGAIQRAIKLSPQATESERSYIQALARRYSIDPQADNKQLALDYSQAMRELSDRYPDDLDAAVLFSESLLDVNPWNQWSLDGKPLSGTMEALQKLNSVLKKDPEHLGANHYFIHVMEASPHPEFALMSAIRLKRLLPSSGHILHMPSHIYLLVGDYQQAARSNEQAVAADREYIREYGMKGNYPLHYLSHNMYFLSRSYIMLGRFEDAKLAADDLVNFYSPHYKMMPDLEYYASAPLSVLLIFHHWKDILDLPKPEEMKIMQVLWHFGRAMAFAGLGNLPDALKEQQIFLEEMAKLPSAEKFGYNAANRILRIADYCLRAKLAEMQQKPNEAIQFLQKAIAEQDALHYNEPPDWFYPVREVLGGLFLRLQRPVEAETVFREELKKHPRNGRALFGLKESLKAQSKTDDLYWVNEEFRKAWMNSDIQLSVQDL